VLRKRRHWLPIDENGKCGYIDQTGSVVISPRFDQCWSFSEGLAGVELQHKLGFIDETGSLVVRPQFPWYPQYFKEGFAPISAGNRSFEQWGFVDKTGKITFLPSVTYVDNFSGGFAVIESKGLRGYVDRSMSIAIEPKYKYASRFNDGLAHVTDDTGSYYIDGAGRKVLDLDGSDFRKGWLSLSLMGNLVSLTFLEIPLLATNSIRPDGSTTACPSVKIRDKWGFIDRSGQIVNSTPV